MKTTKALIWSTALASVMLLALPRGSWAAAILCQTETNNHMLIDDSEVSACLDAGIGNLTGNPENDEFLTGPAGGDFDTVTKSDDDSPLFGLTFTQDNGTGTWSFDPSYWDSFTEAALGFKFGTGGNPDEWFVYQVIPGVSSGNWEFVNVFGQGGGLSHLTLYSGEGTPPAQVSEPGLLFLLGTGILALGGFASRRRRREV
jgi:hypothetical protein